MLLISSLLRHPRVGTFLERVMTLAIFFAALVPVGEALTFVPASQTAVVTFHVVNNVSLVEVHLSGVALAVDIQLHPVEHFLIRCCDLLQIIVKVHKHPLALGIFLLFSARGSPGHD